MRLVISANVVNFQRGPRHKPSVTNNFLFVQLAVAVAGSTSLALPLYRYEL